MVKKDLISQAMALPLEERAMLPRELLASLDGESDDDREQAWAGAIEQRAGEAADGSVELLEGEDVHASLRRKLAARRQ